MIQAALVRCKFVVLAAVMVTASGGELKITKDKHFYEMTFPDSWTIDNTGAVLHGFSEQAKGAKGVISLSGGLYEGGTDNGESLDGIVKHCKKGYVDAQKWKLTGTTTLKMDGVDAVMLTFEREENKAPVISFCYIAVTKKRGYEFIFSCNKAEESIYANEISAIVKSFRITAGK